VSDVWLIRHAESAWNATGRWQGQADPALSPRGREQAAALADELRREPLALLVSSDLVRARETTLAIARVLGVAPRFDARLRERHAGAWAGRTRAEIAARWPEELDRIGRHDHDARPSGGESFREVAERGRDFFRDLAADSRGGPIAVVTHGGVIRALCGVGPVANAHHVRTTLAELCGDRRTPDARSVNMR
jgi:broad specificity phosphatase PhoE